MFKKTVAILFVIALFAGVFPAANQIAYAQEQRYSIELDINIGGLENIKIGTKARDAVVGQTQVTASTDMVNRPFDGDNKPNAQPLEISAQIDGSSIRIVGNSEHGSEFISTKNIFMATATVKVKGNVEQIRNNSHLVDFIINGEKSIGTSIIVDSVQTQMEGGEPGMGNGTTVTTFDVSLHFNLELTGRTYYKIKKADDKKIASDADIGWNMPKLAEPGVTVTFYDCLYGAGISDRVEYHTLDGKRINSEETFVMPERDVEVGIVIKGSGGGGAKPTLVKKLDITLDFENTDKDIYNGKKAPTADDLKKAIKLSSSVKKSGAKVSYAAVDEIYDESFYAQEDYEKAEKWAGNLLLMFKVKLASGYAFSDADVSADEKIDWQEKNVDITLNGKKLHFMQGGLQYANGYFVTEYYMDGNDEIEVHVLWYGVKEADYDISGKKAGDKVDIPDSAFNYKGYFVYKYVLSYTEQNGTTHFDNVDGKSFTMPASDNDGVKLMVKYLRGNGENALKQITKDAADKLDIDTENADFPKNTVVSINRVDDSDKQKHDIAKKALGDKAKDQMLFDISAYAYNMKVQPDGRVIATFPIPDGYDKDHLMFCYISQDGTYQEILLEVDKTKNVGVAVLEHFSLYAIVSTNEATDNSQHVIHIVSPVAQKPASCTENGHKAYFECGCGKIFSDAEAQSEISRDSIVLLAGHSDDDKNNVCDKCQQEVSPEELPSVTPTAEAEPTFSPTSEQTATATEQPTAIIATMDATEQPSIAPTQDDREKSNGGSGTILAITIPAIAIIVIAIVLSKKKLNKKA